MMLDVLIIGCGNIAGGFDAERFNTATPFSHAGAYCAHGGYRLRACVEPDEIRRRAFQRRWQVETAFANLEQAATKGGRYDVVSICSPTPFHAQDLRAVLKMQPRLVFCEKPFTANLEEGRELVAAYFKAGIPLLVNYTRRWDPRVRALAAELARGDWGQVRAAIGCYNKGLYNNGSHMLDLLEFLLGPLVVLAAGFPCTDMWAADPSIPAMLISASGVPVTLNCGHAGDYALFELELITEHGAVKMENGGLDWKVRRATPSTNFAGYQALGPASHEEGAIGGAALSAVTEIQSILVGGALPSCSADHALAVQELCETIRAASRQPT